MGIEAGSPNPAAQISGVQPVTEPTISTSAPASMSSCTDALSPRPEAQDSAVPPMASRAVMETPASSRA
jgi:hypothetical protein